MVFSKDLDSSEILFGSEVFFVAFFSLFFLGVSVVFFGSSGVFFSGSFSSLFFS